MTKFYLFLFISYFVFVFSLTAQIQRDTLLSNQYTKTADSLFAIKEYQKTIDLCEKIAALEKKHQRIEKWWQANDKILKAMVSGDFGSNVEEVHQKMIDILDYAKTKLPENSILLGAIYQVFSGMYLNIQAVNKYDYALNYIHQSIMIEKKQQKLQYSKLAYKYILLGRIDLGYNLGKPGTYQKCINYLYEAEKYFNKETNENKVINQRTLYTILNAYGVCYSNIHQKDNLHQNLDSAIYYYKKGYHIAKKTNNNYDILKTFSNNIAIIYNNSFGTPFKNFNYDSAFVYLKESEVYSLKLIDNRVESKIELSNLYYFLGSNANHRKKIDSSLYYAHKSIQVIYPNFKDNDVMAVPNFSNPNDILNYQQTMKVVFYKMVISFTIYTQTKDKKYLSLAETLIFKLDTLNNHLKKDFTKGKERFDLLSHVSHEYNGILSYLVKEFPERKESIEKQAFYFTESQRNNLLSIHLPQLNKEKNLPIAIKDNMKGLKQQYINKNNEIEVEEIKLRNDTTIINKSKITTYIDVLTKEKIDIFSKIAEIEDTIRRNYPDYYRRGENIDSPTYQNVQSYLDEETIILNYNIIAGSKTDSLLVWCFDNTQTKMYMIDTKELVGKFIPRLDRFRKSCHDDIVNSEYIYIEEGYELYKILVAPIVSQLKGKKRLLLIGDAYFSIFPFKALLTQSVKYDKNKETAWETMPYLTKQFPKGISIYPSLSLLMQNYRLKDNTFENELQIYAPVFDQKNGSQPYNPFLLSAIEASTKSGQRGIFKKNGDIIKFQPIKSTVNEHNKIIDILKKLKLKYKSYLRENATEDHLLKPQNSRILHFITHSFYNISYPNFSGIAFYQPDKIDSLLIKENKKPDGLLMFDEIPLIDMKADLIILSSCESGIGEIANSNVTSLSYKFLCAGVPNVISTLWRIDDEKTSFLFPLFYQYLYENNNKNNQKYDYAEAMQKATQEMINKRKTAKPYFWAGFQIEYSWGK